MQVSRETKSAFWPILFLNVQPQLKSFPHDEYNPPPPTIWKQDIKKSPILKAVLENI